MNIWIVYDSKYGNNKVIAETLASHFKDEDSVHVHYAKDISQKVVSEGDVDMLMFGGPLHLGAPSFTMKRWAKSMAGILNKKAMQVGKMVVWGTHMKNATDTPPKYSWDVAKRKWKAILDTFPAKKKGSDIQGFDIVTIAGKDSLESGWQDNVLKLASTVKNL